MENRSPSFPTEAFAESAGVFSAIAMLTTRAEGLNAHMLSDLRIPTLSIECESCGRAGRYNVEKLIERYGDAKLPELLYVLADCPKARSQSVYDRCKAVYGKDSRWSTSDSLKPS